jgi:nucleoside 2-deoxyribosyltransferase
MPIQLPPEHAYLENCLSKFSEDNVDFRKNLFLIMRFQNQNPFPEIVATIRRVCDTHGLKALRADDREYTDDVWDNVMTYMYGCSSAIAVFDQINYREFNPNVALEVGFMLAQRKPVLLLKDTAIPALPTDIVGKRYRPFDTYDPIITIPPQIGKWIADFRIGEQ